jgi:hypothetical protein
MLTVACFFAACSTAAVLVVVIGCLRVWPGKEVFGQDTDLVMKVLLNLTFVFFALGMGVLIGLAL